MANPALAPAALRRELGVWAASSIVVGTIIGSGIFLVPKTMILQVGSPQMVFLVWICGGLLSLAGALTYAELGAALPEAGGEYVYLREAYGPFWAFVYGWTQMWVAKSGSIATLATGFFTYLANFAPALTVKAFELPIPLGPEGGNLGVSTGQLLAMAVILVLGGINYLGVKLGGEIQVGITAVKLILIGSIICVGLLIGQGTVTHLQTSIPAPGGAAGFFAALVAALWAYDGWNNVSMVSSEVKNPQRNLPLALIFGTLAVVVIYLLTNCAYFYNLSAAQVGGADRVASEMMRTIFGPAGANAVSIAAMISILAALNGSILSGSRVPYAMARDGLFFRPAAAISPRFGTPGGSLAMLCTWAALLVLSGSYDQLFNYVIFASWILYAMAAASVIVLRRKRPDLVRPYRVIGYPVLPLLFVLAAVSLLASTYIHSPRESNMGIVLILIGVPFYYWWKRRLPMREREG